MKRQRTSELPGWALQTPEPDPNYWLQKYGDGVPDAVVEHISLSRREYIRLKERLAELRGLLVPTCLRNDIDPPNSAKVFSRGNRPRAFTLAPPGKQQADVHFDLEVSGGDRGAMERIYLTCGEFVDLRACAKGGGSARNEELRELAVR